MLFMKEKTEKGKGHQSTMGRAGICWGQIAALLNKMTGQISFVGKLVKSATDWE